MRTKIPLLTQGKGVFVHRMGQDQHAGTTGQSA